MLTRMPTWKFDLAAFSGDSWAAALNQDPVPSDRLARVYQRPIRYRASIRASAVDGSPITPDGTTIDISVVKVVKSQSFAFGASETSTNYQLKSIAETAVPTGEQPLGEYTELDVDPADQVAIGVRSITVDGGAPPAGTKFLWLETGPGLEDAWPTPQEITGEDS